MQHHTSGAVRACVDMDLRVAHGNARGALTRDAQDAPVKPDLDPRGVETRREGMDSHIGGRAADDSPPAFARARAINPTTGQLRQGFSIS